MKKIMAVAIAVAVFGWLSDAQAAGATFRLGGGLNTNSARVSDGMVFGVHGANDFPMGETPWTIGIFGEGNFSEKAGKPMLAGVNLFYKASMGGSKSRGLDPKIYFGPSLGIATMDLGQRETALHLGATLGVEFPLSESVGLFGNAKYAWANSKDGVVMINGFSTHVGLMFNLGN